MLIPTQGGHFSQELDGVGGIAEGLTGCSKL